MSSIAAAILLVLAALPQAGSAAPAAAEVQGGSGSGDARAELVAEQSGSEQRLAAALALLDADARFLIEQMTVSESDGVAIAALRALEQRADSRATEPLELDAVLGLAVAGKRVDVAEQARRTLLALAAAERAGELGPLKEQLARHARGADAALAAVACEVLGSTRDLAVAPALAEALARGPADGPLAAAAAAGLEVLFQRSLGPDPSAWQVVLDSARGRTRDQVLEDSIRAERALFEARLQAKNTEIARLHRDLDADDPEALQASLSHDLPEVRRFAAESLSRRISEWDVTPARDVVLARLEEGKEPEEVAAAFLQLLAALDQTPGEPAPDARRDAVIAKALKSRAPHLVAAAAAAAEAFPLKQVRDAVVDAVGQLRQAALGPDARTALVRACGRLKLVAAREPLVAMLWNDPATEVRVAAAHTLGQLAIPETRDDLAHALADDTEWEVRRKAAPALAAVAGEAAVETLVKALGDSRAEVRSAVAEALSRFELPAAIAALSAQLDRETEIQADVIRALGRFRSEAALDALCSAAAAIPALPAGADDAVEDELRRALREALLHAAGSDAARWRSVADRMADLGRPRLAKFALGQRLRVLTDGAAPPREVLAARIELVRIARLDGDLETALGAAVLDPPATGEADLRGTLLVLQAELRAESGDAAGARGALEEALRSGGLETAERRAASERLARLCFDAGEYQAAAELLRSEDDLAPAGVLLLAAAEVRSGKPSVALVRVRDLRSQNLPADPALAFELEVVHAEAALEAGDVAAARAALERAGEPPAAAGAALAARREALLARLAARAGGS